MDSLLKFCQGVGEHCQGKDMGMWKMDVIHLLFLKH